MPATTLSVQLSDLAAKVGHYLGYNRTASTWSGWDTANPYKPLSLDTQLGTIMAVIEDGLRQFYFPPPGQDGKRRRWNFLMAERTLTLTAGTTDYTMPIDHGRFEGDMNYAAGLGVAFAVRRTGIESVRRSLAMSGAQTNKPAYYAQVDIWPAETVSQRKAAVLYPSPDSAYVLTYRASLLPPRLDNANPYPYGAAAHGETMVASCLAIAELRVNDEAGVCGQAYQERLAASVAYDMEDYEPEIMGFNYDRTNKADLDPRPVKKGK